VLRRTTFTAVFLALAASTHAAPPPAEAPSAIPLKAGDTVSFDLSALPDRLEGEAKATCIGTRISAIGPTEARCVRPLRFEVDPGDARMTFVFKGAADARRRERPAERRIDLPIRREKRPITFVAPSDGTLDGPSTSDLAADAAEKAANALAARACAGCAGEGFRLEKVEVTREPAADLPVRIGITPAPR